MFGKQGVLSDTVTMPNISEAFCNYTSVLHSSEQGVMHSYTLAIEHELPISS